MLTAEAKAAPMMVPATPSREPSRAAVTAAAVPAIICVRDSSKAGRSVVVSVRGSAVVEVLFFVLRSAMVIWCLVLIRWPQPRKRPELVSWFIPRDGGPEPELPHDDKGHVWITGVDPGFRKTCRGRSTDIFGERAAGRDSTISNSSAARLWRMFAFEGQVTWLHPTDTSRTTIPSSTPHHRLTEHRGRPHTS